MALVPMRTMLDHAAEHNCGIAAFAPRQYLGPAREAMGKACVARMIAFGQAGNAGRIKAVTCRGMVSFYRGK